MANVVPIQDIAATVYEATRQAINGLVALRKAGMAVEMPDAFEFSLPIALPGGINAIPRTQASASADRNSIESDSGLTEQTSSTGSTNGTENRSSEETLKEDASTTSNESQVQSQAFGRKTEVDIQYES